jgi:hypothetical protein
MQTHDRRTAASRLRSGIRQNADEPAPASTLLTLPVRNAFAWRNAVTVFWRIRQRANDQGDDACRPRSGIRQNADEPAPVETHLTLTGPAASSTTTDNCTVKQSPKGSPTSRIRYETTHVAKGQTTGQGRHQLCMQLRQQ